MEDLQLSPMRNDGKLVWQYKGSWFWLDSTADEAMTRRSIVRLEQIFTAYRQLLHRGRSEARRLTIRMFGDNQHYHAAFSELGLEIRNPAVYLADEILFLAGGDMNRFDAELAQINRQHRQVKQQFDARWRRCRPGSKPWARI